MGYKLKQWIIEYSRTGQVDKVRAKGRRTLEKRLGEQAMEYISIVGVVKSLAKSRRAREELEERLGKQTIFWG